MLKKKWLLSCWLVFLAVCSILPGIKRVSPVIAEQSPNSVFIDNHLKSESLDLSIDLSTRPNLHFDCLTAADGLSFSLVTSILQDQRGLCGLERVMV